MKLSCFRTSIVDRDSDQRVFRIVLGIFHKDIKISIVIENSGVKQFVLKLFPRTPRVGLHQVEIGKFLLRVFVQVLHVRVGGGTVEIEVVFLDVFAVVALIVCQAKQALLQDGVAAVPQRQRETKLLLIV